MSSAATRRRREEQRRATPVYLDVRSWAGGVFDAALHVDLRVDARGLPTKATVTLRTSLSTASAAVNALGVGDIVLDGVDGRVLIPARVQRIILEAVQLYMRTPAQVNKVTAVVMLRRMQRRANLVNLGYEAAVVERLTKVSPVDVERAAAAAGASTEELATVQKVVRRITPPRYDEAFFKGQSWLEKLK